MLTLYVVVNAEGKYFHAKGRNGSGSTWTDDFQKARIYTRLQPARACVSFFANHYKYSVAPAIIVLKVTDFEQLNETERVEAVKAKQERLRKQRDVQKREEDLREARRKVKEAQEVLEKAYKCL